MNFNSLLSQGQIELRNWIHDLTFNWSFFVTLTYPWKAGQERVKQDVNLIQRRIGKACKTQCLYFGIFRQLEGFSHAHIIYSTKRLVDLVDLFFIEHTIKDFIITKAFPFNYSYRIDLIGEGKDEFYKKSKEKISQYLVKKDHAEEEDLYLFIHSNPKRIRKFVNNY